MSFFCNGFFITYSLLYTINNATKITDAIRYSIIVMSIMPDTIMGPYTFHSLVRDRYLLCKKTLVLYGTCVPSLSFRSVQDSYETLIGNCT